MQFTVLSHYHSNALKDTFTFSRKALQIPPVTYQASFFLLRLFLISQSTLRSLGSTPSLGTAHSGDEPGPSSCPPSKQGVCRPCPRSSPKNLCQQKGGRQLWHRTGKVGQRGSLRGAPCPPGQHYLLLCGC